MSFPPFKWMNKTLQRPPVVLVVEDEALARLVAASALSDAGFEVLEAASAAEAMAVFAARNEIDVLFTDVQMPGLSDGYSLAKWVHAGWPGVHFLITSGNSRPLADDGTFMGKPYPLSEIVDHIRQITSWH